MQPPKVYRYSAITREYIGEGFAEASPLEPGVFLVPADATLEPPPAAMPGYVIKFATTYWFAERSEGA